MTLQVFSVATDSSAGGGDFPARPSTESYSLIRLGPGSYPVGRSDAHCMVCQSNYRQYIEEKMSHGAGLKVINRGLPPDWRISELVLSRHALHCLGTGLGLTWWQHREYLKENGLDEAESPRNPNRTIDIVNEYIQMQAQSGAYAQMKPLEALAWVNAQATAIERERSTVGADAYRAILKTFMEVVRAQTTPAQQAEIVRMLDENPELRAIADMLSGKPTPQVIEAPLAVPARWSHEGYEG